jgi:hypothetical protein
LHQKQRIWSHPLFTVADKGGAVCQNAGRCHALDLGAK